MAVTSPYRLTSKEVGKISTTGQDFSDWDTNYFGVLIDPTTPDGTTIRDESTDPPGPRRVLGLCKIAEPGPNNIRNATQAEIDTFADAELVDDNGQAAGRADELFTLNPHFRRLLIAFADVLRDEINILRGRNVEFQTDVAAASNLGDLKDSVAAYPVQSDRTLAQLKTAIRNRISADD